MGIDHSMEPWSRVPRNLTDDANNAIRDAILNDATRFAGGNIDAQISTRAVPGDQMALTAAERLTVQALIINDVTPFAGADIDTNIGSRAVPGDAMALTPAERLVVQALIIDDTTPFSGADIAAILTDTGAIVWGDITGIVNDIGVFPTANYATVAAYVEDIRTRLTALATSVVPEAVDETNDFTWVTLTHGVNEFDISSLFATALTGTTRRKYSLFLDLTDVEGDAAAWTECTIKVKVKVDAANYRTVDKHIFAKTDVAAAEEPGINIDIPAVAQDVQVTMQFDVQLGANQDIYYHIVTEVLE